MDVTKACWDAAAAPVDMSYDTDETEAFASGSDESDDGSDEEWTIDDE